jgi:heme-degrading monooxygenase HmoA
MFARSTTFRGRPEAVDAGIALVRDEIMPAIQAMYGYRGLSMLVDRDSGRCIVTTGWDSEREMRATASTIREMRERTAQTIGGPAEVSEFEVAVLHRVRRTGRDACARVTWMRTEPLESDRQIDIFRLGIVPKLEVLPGFCSTSLLVDRECGLGAAAVIYENRQAMLEAEREADHLRADAVRMIGAEVVEVAAFDVALAHLHATERV